MEAQLVNEFVSRTGASPSDAMSCLSTWGFDLKRALTDYNDTSTNDYLINIGGQGDQQPPSSYNQSTTNSLEPLLQLAAHNPMYSELPVKGGGGGGGSVIAHDPTNSSADLRYKKLERGISRATENATVVSRARNEMAMDFQAGGPLVDIDKLSPCAPYYTFTIPDLTVYSEEFRKFLEKDLIETSTLVSLEASQRLNWWASAYICQKLWPLSTTGDGNCLLHAASLAMWGFHDRKLTLRTALHNLLSHGEYRDALWRRWRFQQTKLNKQAGLVFSDYEWAKEWDEIVMMASPEPRHSSDSAGGSTSSASSAAATRRRSFVVDTVSLSGGDKKKNVTYESLEEIHLLALAHVLGRTIIVVADTMLRDMNGEAMAPINFTGIYLPFEIPAEECHRSPLLLTYDTAHFSALVPMDSASDFPPSLIPLVDCENKLLPVQFCIDPGADFDWRSYDSGEDGVWQLSENEYVVLLKAYLNVIYAMNPSSPDDEIYEDYWTDEEGKQFGDSEVVLSDDNQPKKTTKQLQNVAKQFGSIGKNMSKKIKKNFGSITSNFKHGTGPGGSSHCLGQKKHSGGSTSSSSGGSQKSGSISRFSKVLCAELKCKKHPYQQEMINNYLECAHNRFRELYGVDGYLKEDKGSPQPTPSSQSGVGGDLGQPQTVALTNTPISLTDSIVHCINTGCQNFGTSTTSYMCEECYERQRKQEADCKFVNTGPRYGTGNSKFYTETDLATHKQVQNIPPVRGLHERDQTLYLSNSTFFNDRLAGNARTAESGTGSKVINHRILVEGLDYNHPIPFGSQLVGPTDREQRPVPPPRRESQQSNRQAVYFGEPEGAQPCKTVGCSFYGNPNTNYFCSKCRQNFGAAPAKILTDV